jgi:hypothetical protein
MRNPASALECNINWTSYFKPAQIVDVLLTQSQDLVSIQGDAKIAVGLKSMSGACPPGKDPLCSPQASVKFIFTSDKGTSTQVASKYKLPWMFVGYGHNLAVQIELNPTNTYSLLADGCIGID